MKVKRVLVACAVVAALGASAVAVYAGVQTSAFEASLDRVYDVPVAAVVRSTVASWQTTSSPSAVAWTSSSTAVAPTSSA